MRALGEGAAADLRADQVSPHLGSMHRADALEYRREVEPAQPFGWSLLREPAAVTDLDSARRNRARKRWCRNPPPPDLERTGTRMNRSKMRILILSQFFPPEIGATQTRVHAFAAGLAERGHSVEVICEVPNHPHGVIQPGYRRRALIRRRDPDGFGVTYVWVYTTPEKTMAKRLAFYGTYTALATAVGATRSRPDVILASSPPLPVALAGDLIATRHRVPWVMDVRDLWPAAAVGMGELEEGRGLRLAERLEARLYNRAAAIIAVTEPFREKIAQLTDPAKIHVIPNGTTQFWLDAAAIDPDRSRARPSRRRVHLDLRRQHRHRSGPRSCRSTPPGSSATAFGF